MINKVAIQIKQGRFIFYLIALNGRELLDNSTIAYFKSGEPTDLGYQRPLVKSHYSNLSKYLQEEEAILPPAIITAIESEKLKFENGRLIVNNELRVVDGQHRIEAIKNLEKTSPIDFKKTLEFEFPIIIMSIEPNDKIHEINTFIHINKKGKKVSTNLAVSITERLRLQLNSNKLITFKETIESIAAMTCNNLVADNKSIWFQSISLGDEITRTKPVSINLFTKSLLPLISVYLTKKLGYQRDNFFKSSEINTFSKNLNELILNAWNKVQDKWPSCFSKSKFKYNDEYNIQKGIGVTPLHAILAECMEESNGEISNANLIFSRIIDQCELPYSAWKSGGRFSGYNSKMGFEIIAKVIKNQQEPEEEEEEELY